MKGKIASIYFALKQNKNTEAKRSEKKNMEANQSEKKNMRAKNEKKRKTGSKMKRKKNTEKKIKIRKGNEAERKILKVKRREKIDAKFSLKHAKQNRNESRFASLRLEVKKNLKRNRRTLLWSRVCTKRKRKKFRL
jgi:hypothetical protein